MIEERKYSESIKEGRFVKTVLDKAGKDILSAQSSVMSRNSFKNVPRLPRGSIANSEILKLRFTKTHRFIDMRVRSTKQGKKHKKSYPIYNRIIFGHLNNIIKELSYGFTEAVKEEFKKLDK